MPSGGLSSGLSLFTSAHSAALGSYAQRAAHRVTLRVLVDALWGWARHPAAAEDLLAFARPASETADLRPARSLCWRKLDLTLHLRYLVHLFQFFPCLAQCHQGSRLKLWLLPV